MSRKTGWRGASAANAASGLERLTQLLDGFSSGETAQLKSMLQRLARNASNNSQD